MTVTFCGHSSVPNSGDVLAWLTAILPSVIEDGAKTFYLGGYEDFDHLAARALRQQKVIYPHIEIILVPAYLDRAVNASGYDGTIYPPLEQVPRRYAILKRNEWMVSVSELAISGVTHDWGGAARTLAFARKKKKVITIPYCLLIWWPFNYL